MQIKFRALSLSHKTAPVQIRELISLDEEAIQRILLKLKDFFSLSDALVISTCNRTEVYYGHELDLSTEIIKLLGLEKGITDVVNYLDYFEVFDQWVIDQSQLPCQYAPTLLLLHKAWAWFYYDNNAEIRLDTKFH